MWVKVSGMITEADWYNWKPDDIKPYVDMLLDWYGPSRLMFGSDWPVCTLAGTYSQVYDTAAYCFSGLNSDDLAAVFGEKCRFSLQAGRFSLENIIMSRHHYGSRLREFTENGFRMLSPGK